MVPDGIVYGRTGTREKIKVVESKNLIYTWIRLDFYKGIKALKSKIRRDGMRRKRLF